MTTTVTLSAGLPSYDWVNLLTGAMILGQLTSSDSGHATLTVANYTSPLPDTLPVTLLTVQIVGSNISVDTGSRLFTSGSITSMSLVADSTTVASVSYANAPDFNAINALLAAAHENPLNANDITFGEQQLFYFEPVSVTGSSDSETLYGGITNNSSMDGGAGNDTFEGSLGNDSITTGTGSDVIHPSLGQDVVTDFDLNNDKIDVSRFGVMSLAGAQTFLLDLGNHGHTVFNFMGDGTLTLNGVDYSNLTADNFIFAPTPGGYNLVEGTVGPDTLAGTSGDDIISSYYGADSVDAGAGNDSIFGFGSSDTLNGDEGNDWIDGQDGSDLIHGGEGNDTLIGGENSDPFGNDTIYGDDGDDLIFGSAGNDQIHGGAGTDTLSFMNETGPNGLSVTFTADGAGTLTDTFYDGNMFTGSTNFDGIEVFDASLNADSITGSSANDIILAEGGNDTVIAGDGADTIDGGDGNDLIDGGAGNDSLTGGTGADTFVASTGNDVISDFVSGTDKIDVSNFGISSFAQLQALFDDANHAIDFAGGSTLTLTGITPSTGLQASDFIFASPTAQIDLHVGVENGVDWQLLLGTVFTGTLAIVDPNTATLTFPDYDNSGLDLVLTLTGSGLASSDTSTFDAGAQVGHLELAWGPTSVASFDLGGASASDTQLNAVFAEIGHPDYADTIGHVLFQGPTVINGSDDSEEIFGSADFRVTINGGDGNDSLHSGAGGGEIHGGDGNDVINGDNTGPGVALYGDAGDDTLGGTQSDDTLDGGAGNDVIHGDLGTGDLLTYAGETGGNGIVLTINDDGTGSATDTYGDADTFDGIEMVEGSRYDDTITGSDHGDYLVGGNGNDSIVGNGGDQDRIFGGDGNDTIDGSQGTQNLLEGEAGNDSIIGGTDFDTLLGGDGNDTLLGGGGVESLDGGAGDDFLSATDGPGSNFVGGEGNDTLIGGVGSDNLSGGEGNDSLVGADSSDFLSGGVGDDWIDAGGGGDYILGSSGADTVLAGSEYDQLDFSVSDDGGDHSNDGIVVSFDNSGDADSDLNQDGPGSGTVTGQFGGNTVSMGFISVEQVLGTTGSDAFHAVSGASGTGDSMQFYLPDGNDQTDDSYHALNVVGGDGADSFVDDSGAMLNDGSNSVGVLYVDYGREQQMHGDNGSAYGDGLDSNSDPHSEPGVIINLSSSGPLTVDSGVAAATGQAAGTVEAQSALDTFGNVDTFGGGTGVHAFGLTDAGDYFTAAGSGESYTVDSFQGNDTLIGGQGRDRFQADEGDDSIVGGGGGSDTNDARDNIDAGSGDDTIDATGSFYQHDGNVDGSWLRPGAGNDFVIGSEGNDYIVGGSGQDTILAGGGHDQIAYENESWDGLDHSGDNVAITLDDATVVNGNPGGQGSGTIVGQYAEAVVATQFSSVEQFRGTAGDDSFTVNENATPGSDANGFELKEGHNGNQFYSAFEFSGGAGDDTISGSNSGQGKAFLNYNNEQWMHDDVGNTYGDGLNSHNLSSFEPGVVINLSNDDVDTTGDIAAATGQAEGTVQAGTALDTFGNTDTLSNVHGFQLTDTNDYFTDAGSGFQVNVDAGQGDDTLIGGTGRDKLNGGDGSDSIFGGGGGSNSNDARDDLDGGDGNDTIDATGSFWQQPDGYKDGSWIRGGAGSDSITGSEGSDYYVGGSGTDTIHGNGGNDALAYENEGRYDGLDHSLDGVNVTFNSDGVQTGTVEGSYGGHTVDTTFDSIRHFKGTTGGDSVTVEDGADLGSSNGPTFQLKQGDGNNHDFQAFVVSGGAGDDTITGSSADHGEGKLIVNYHDEQWMHDNVGDTYGDNLDGNGDAAPEPGVVVNLSGSTLDITGAIAAATGQQEQIVAGGTALDTYGSTDTLSDIHAYQLTDTNDYLTNAGSDVQLNIEGNAGDDTIIGGTGRDWVHGDEGNDSIGGGGGGSDTNDGRDDLDGGDGNDTLDATGSFFEQPDGYKDGSWLRGGAGNDSIIGSDGGDNIIGGSGQDTIQGGAGSDRLAFELEGDNLNHSGDHIDVTFHNAGNGTMTGSYGAAAINTTFTSIEVIQGTQGNDTITLASDVVTDDDSPDFYLSDPSHPDQDNHRFGIRATGGDGADTFTDNTTQFGHTLIINYGDEQGLHPDFDGNHQWGQGSGEHGVVINLSGSDKIAGTDFSSSAVSNGTHVATGKAIDTFGQTDTINGVQAFQLTNASDVFLAGSAGYSVGMNDGDDTFIGGAGWDNVDGGGGNDSLVGGDGNDWLGGRGGNDFLSGGDGNDDINGGPGQDTIDGGAGWDNLNYDDDRDEQGHTTSSGVIVNLSGHELDSVTAEGQAPGQTVAAHSAIDSWGDTDLVTGIESLNGTQFGDYIVAPDGDSNVNGNGGNDTIIAGAGGFANLSGGEGNDHIDLSASQQGWASGDRGNDTITLGNGENVGADAGSGNDSILGGSGSNYIVGGAGADTVDGGTNWDGLSYNNGTNSDSSITFDVTGSGSGTVSGTYDPPWDDVGNGGDDGDSGTVDGTIFSNIENLVGTAGNDTFKVENGAGGSSDGSIIFYDRRDFLGGDRAIQLVGGQGDDIFTDNSGRASGNSFVNYDEEKWSHQDATDNGNRNFSDEPWGSRPGENGVVVNLSTHDKVAGPVEDFVSTAVSTGTTVAAGTAIDTFGDTDTFNGTTGVHAVNLTQADDVFFAGDDASGYLARGNEGNDLLVGGAGADILDGGAGDDSISGGGGNDEIFGDDGQDTLIGGDGDDIISGGNDSDTLVGGDGSDAIDGGDGWDILDYGQEGGANGVSVNLLAGTATDTYGAHDTIKSIEEVRGTAQGDLLIGDFHENVLLGGAGNDTIIGNGSDGLQIDRAGYWTSTAAINANLVTQTVTDGWGSTDTIIGIEGIIGGNGNDTIVGDGNANILAGGWGQDTLTFGGGNDTLDYGDSGSGVTVNLSAASINASGPTLAVASGTALDGNGTGHGSVDTITDRLNVEAVRGSNHADQIVAGTTGLTMLGLEGNDTLTGGAGTDTADYSQDDNWGGNGPIIVNFTANPQEGVAAGHVQDGFGDTDTLTSVEVVVGTSHGDDFFGGAGAETFRGMDGHDYFVASGGNDTLDGGNDVDMFDASATSVGMKVNLSSVTQGAGANSIVAGTASSSTIGTDSLSNIEEVMGSSGADTIYGTDNPGNGWYDNGFWGLAGNDSIVGLGGFDVAYYNQDANHGGTRGVIVNLGSGSQTITAGMATATGQGVAQFTLNAGSARDGFGNTDTLSGIEGIQGTNSNDIFFGSSTLTPNDAVLWQGLGGNDTINGTAEFDIVDYVKDDENGGAGKGVVVNLSANPLTITSDEAAATGQTAGSLAAGAARDGFGNTDTLVSVDEVRATSHNDLLVGPSTGGSFLLLDGMGGNDTIVGGQNVYASYHDDQNYGAGGGVNVDLAAGVAHDGFGGTDTLIDVDNVQTSDSDDVIVGNDSDNTIYAQGGNDIIQGSLGTDSVDGGGGYFDQLNFNTARADTGSVGLTVVAGAPSGAGTVNGTNIDIGESTATVATSFTNLEHVSGSQSDDSFTVTSGFVGSTDSISTYRSFTNPSSAIGSLGSFDVSGGDGNDSFTDNSTVQGGVMTVSYDGDTRGQIDPNDNHQWGSRAGEHGVIVNLTGGDKISGTNFSSSWAGTATVSGGTALDTYGDTDTFTNVHQFWLTSADDVFFGSDVGGFVNGYYGDDLLMGGAGDDELIGGRGNDTIDGGGGINTVTYGDAFQSDGTTNVGVIVNLQSAGNVVVGSQTVAAGTAIDDFGTTDTLSNIQVVVGTSHADVIYGSSSSSTLMGGVGDDVLVGGSNADVLVGDSGSDTLNGGGGNDTVDYSLEIVNDNANWPYNGQGLTRHGIIVNLSNANQVVNGGTIAAGTAIDSMAALNGQGSIDHLISIEGIIGTEFNDTIFGGNGETLNGGNGNDSIVSDSGNDTVIGGAGNDTLVTGGGTDVLEGDGGNDTFVISAGTTSVTISDFGAGDSIDLTAFTGVSTVQSALSSDGAGGSLITLGSTVIHLVGVPQANVSDSSFTFNAINGSGTINGTANDDTINGSAGVDSIRGLGGNDLIFGLGSNDILIGDDTVAGGTGNDTLDGGAGNDTMSGGGGDDTYYVDSTADVVNESQFGGAGIDTVISTVTFSLADTIHAIGTIENLTLAGSANINGTGNTANNVLTGNSGNNSLDGGTGNDTITGGAGTDTLNGNAGNDTFIVDSTTDSFVEAAGGGTDTVVSSVTFSLATATGATQIENLTLAAGAGSINGTGNTLNNVLTGNEGNNSLDGGTGNDTLNGGTGTDTLTGGAGNDTFIVDSTTDIINEAAAGGTDTVISSVSFDLSASAGLQQVENLTLAAGAGNINGTGNGLNNVITGNTDSNSLDGGAGNDSLVGGGGNDTLNGNTGNDTMVGGSGDDLYFVDSASDVVSETIAAGGGTDTVSASVSFSIAALANIENLVLTGGATTGTGNALNNIITGNNLSNTLNGGAGADTMNGGTSSDTFVVDNAGDVINDAGGSADLVQSGITFSIASMSFIENLTLTGTAAINATGNTGNNVITGNTGANSLAGGDGNDVLIGNGGTDTLDGGLGADTMTGGAGNDTYIVDDAGDVINADPGGVDTVQSSITFSLATLAAVENLTLTGTASNNATGNALANTLTGNIGNNSLDGGTGNDSLIGNDGNDTLQGGAGNDTMIGGAGDDTYYVDVATDVVNETIAGSTGTDTVHVGGTLTTYTLGTNVENLVVDNGLAFNAVGNGLNNVITGNNAGDTLNGGVGNDTMNGGTGNDTYFVDSALDVVNDAGGAADTVSTSLSYTLQAGNGIENLILTGTAADGTGNDVNNVITGNASNNSLDGGDGNDSLVGAAGADTLIGGLGNDTLDGGAGTDSLVGGDGDDTYVIDVLGDIVDESASTGTDSITYTGATGGTYTLGANIENFTATAAAAMTIVGNGADNRITGFNGNDSLRGDVGNDTLVSGNGNDTLNGGDGNDVYVLNGTGNKTIIDSSGTDEVQANITYILTDISGIENLTLIGTTNINGTGNSGANIITGNTGNNSLVGGGGDDVITGGGGNDTIDGGIGADTMTGGAGNDLYIVDDINDVVTDDPGGNDTVQAGASFSLALLTTIEGLTLTGAGNIDGTGNALANTITGNSGNNSIDGGDGNDSLIGNAGNDTLQGGIGNDTMAGGAGNDIYYVDSALDVVNETLTGSAGIDTVHVGGALTAYTLGTNVENLIVDASGAFNAIGNTLANVITGNDDGDTLNGGAGSDTMNGGTGNDTYVVDSASDIINDAGGIDTVSAAISYTLQAGNGIENLTLTGTAGVGVGNELDNFITGNASANTLNGGTGVDTLVGGAGNDAYIVDGIDDVVTEGLGGGTDTVTFNGTSGTYLLGANIENLTLGVVSGASYALNATGNNLANLITGNAASNILDGGVNTTGVDTLVGGAGNDIYMIRNVGDVITEAANAGTDTVHYFGTGTYTLAANVENLVIEGSGNVNGTGSAVDNVMTGNSGVNVLNGAAGNDTLDGNGGGDSLIGGAGDDTYIVRAAGDHVDESTNAGAGTDTVLSYVDFSLVGGAGHQVTAGTVENLTLLGTAISATGNDVNNTLIGNASNNVILGAGGNDLILGGDGDDTIDGGTGHDQIFGGAGNDKFVYSDADFGVTATPGSGSAAANSDTIFDYSAGDSFDLRQLVSDNDLINVQGDVDGILRVVSVNGAYAIELNEGAALHNQATADWSAAFNVYTSNPDNITVTVGDNTGTTYHWDSGTGHFIV